MATINVSVSEKLKERIARLIERAAYIARPIIAADAIAEVRTAASCKT